MGSVVCAIGLCRHQMAVMSCGVSSLPVSRIDIQLGKASRGRAVYVFVTLRGGSRVLRS